MTVGETNQSRSAADLIKRDDAPEQIFASQGDDGWRWPRASKFPEQGDREDIKYVRADLVDPAATRKAALQAYRADVRKAALLDAGYDTPVADSQPSFIPAAIREAAWVELAQIIRKWRNDVPMTGEECANAILALIGEKK